MDYKLLIEKANLNKFEAIEVYERNKTELGIAVFNGVVDKNELSDLSTVSIRAIFDGKIAYLDLENKEESVDFILDNLKNNANSLTTEDKFFIFEGSPTYPKVDFPEDDFDKYTQFEKIEFLKQLEATMKQIDKRIVYVPYCNYNEVRSSIRIVNSRGLDIRRSGGFCVIIAQAVARENEDSQSSYKVEVKTRLEQVDFNALAKEVVEKTVSMLNAKSMPSKTCPVIIEKTQMGDILNAFQSIFSGEAAVKKVTPLIGKENTAIMSEKITIVDDPLNTKSICAQPFDDEGVACFTKTIVDQGVFKSFIHNLKTAAYFKTTSTGNGSKVGGSIGVSPINMYIAPGTQSKEELIANLTEGFFVTSIEGLHAGVNAVSGDFSLKASGFLIESGELTRPVTLVVISGNFFKMMKDVVAIANDLEYDYKGISSPSIQFTGLAVSGE